MIKLRKTCDTNRWQIRLFAFIFLLTIVFEFYSVFYVKDVLTVAKFREEIQVCASGEFIGIKINMGGLLVVGTDDILDNNGKKIISPAKAAGLVVGDIIEDVSDERVATVDDFIKIIQAQKDNVIKISYRRGGKLRKCKFRSVYDEGAGDYKIGAWVKDTCLGLGTITYFEPKTGKYAGVGHTILDEDTNHIVPFIDGEIYEGIITGIRKGEAGLPGEIKGTFASISPLGTIDNNSNTGIRGVLNNKEPAEIIRVAKDKDIQKGPAYILCEPFGKKEKFEIEVEKVSMFGGNDKGLTIRVTDKRLIERTGGIVQGMSGSPIIQNGKLIGTVTHVFIGDPTMGYAAKISEFIK